MDSSTPLKLSGLRDLADMHYDVGVLSLMQTDVLLQCIETMQLTGNGRPMPQQVLEQAELALPSGSALQQMYFRRYAALTSEPVERLEATARHLARCAQHLEGIAARDLSKRPLADGGHPISMDTAAQIISQRYAQLIQAATTLEQHGVISVTHSERITGVAERPDGPLAPYFDKAMALVQHQVQRPRMAA